MATTPTGSPSRRPRLQYPQPHGSSSSSLGGMEKVVPSFQSFSNSSIQYVDKPLPPVPTRHSSDYDYSPQGEIIETYTKINRKSSMPGIPSIYVQPASYSSSASQLPSPVPSKPFYRQHQHHSSASLRTGSKDARLSLDSDNDSRIHAYTYETELLETSAERAIGKSPIADHQLDQPQELNPPRVRSPTPPGFKAFPYDTTLKLQANMDPVEFDYELVPPPLNLRTSPEPERPTSRFSSNSDDDSDDDSHSVARDSFLSHFRLKPSSLESRPSSKGSRRPPSSLGKDPALDTDTIESPTGKTKRFSSLAKEKSNTLRNTFLSMYPKYSKHSPRLKTSRFIPSEERTMGGPDTPYPATTPTSPPTGKAKTFSVTQGHNLQLREVLDTATLGVTRSKAEKRRRALKNSISLVGKAEPLGDVKDHEWL